MKKVLSVFIIAAGSLVAVSNANAQTKDVLDVAAASPAHSTLVSAVKAADLTSTLKGAGPYTVFAPTNDAFAKLGSTVEDLMKPENKEQLASVLSNHVVTGAYTTADVQAAIQKGNGKAELPTVGGGKLTATLDGDKVKLTDENGNSSILSGPDMKGSNGIVHSIDAVVLPKAK